MSKTVLITGGTSGFGRVAAFGPALSGHKVIAGDRIRPQVRDMRTEVEARSIGLEVIELDILDAIDRTHAPAFDVDAHVRNVGIIAAVSHLFRTVKPDAMEDLIGQGEAAEWRERV